MQLVPGGGVLPRKNDLNNPSLLLTDASIDAFVNRLSPLNSAFTHYQHIFALLTKLELVEISSLGFSHVTS